MKPRLIVIDLDGTLLDRAGRVPEAHREAVLEAREHGLEVVIATGRNWAESADALRSIDDHGVMICAGGAMLCGSLEGEVIRSRTLPSDRVADIAERIIAHGHLAHLLQDHGRCEVDYILVGRSEPDPATTWWLREHDVRARFVDDLDGIDLTTTMRVGTVGTSSTLHSAVDEVRATWGDAITLQHWPAVVESAATGTTTHLLEIFDRGVDKWAMIVELIADRGLRPEQVVAIGDGLNDVMMVREAGTGIAMGQADPRVGEVADHVVASNEEAGVAEAIRHVLERS